LNYKGSEVISGRLLKDFKLLSLPLSSLTHTLEKVLLLEVEAMDGNAFREESIHLSLEISEGDVIFVPIFFSKAGSSLLHLSVCVSLSISN
jgi:hypothetical protein